MDVRFEVRNPKLDTEKKPVYDLPLQHVDEIKILANILLKLKARVLTSIAAI